MESRPTRQTTHTPRSAIPVCFVVWRNWSNRTKESGYHVEEWDTLENAALVVTYYRTRGWKAWIFIPTGDGRTDQWADMEVIRQKYTEEPS